MATNTTLQKLDILDSDGNAFGVNTSNRRQVETFISDGAIGLGDLVTFDVVDGGYVHNEESMFSSNIVDMPQKEEVSEPEPEPIKTTNKKAASGGSNNSSLDDILGDWDD